MQSDDDDVICCDDDVICCDDIVEISQPMLVDTAENPGPSKTTKRSRKPSVIEILDSDDEDEPVDSSTKKVQKDIDDVKSKEIQKIVNELMLQFGDKSKLQAQVELPPSAWQKLSVTLEIYSHENQDFYSARALIVLSGVINLAFDCLSFYTHHFPEKAVTNVPVTKVPCKPRTLTSKTLKPPGMKWNRVTVKSNGTGFGAGAISSQWKPEETLKKQINEEKHITALLQVIATYINPQDEIPSDTQPLPLIFIEILEQSCLVPVLRSYLRNDSVLDMTRHIPLYRAITLLIRAISTCNQLVHLLMLKQDESDEPIADLLSKIKSCTDSYKSRLNGVADDDAELNIFIDDVITTSFLVESATYLFLENKQTVDQPQTQTVDQKYVEVMKEVQFDSFEMIESNGNDFRFTVAYRFEATARSNGTQGSSDRIKRLAQEYATLPNSLPLSFSSSVFVRSDNSRMDVMKCLITGPANTPYENGCFIFDVYFPPQYPKTPPLVNIETTGLGSVRFNPNLYACGKVCLSLLNTWGGRPEEKWNAKTSSFLQVLVSIQSLILVDDPYFNEPGCQSMRGTADGTRSSNQYNHVLYPSTIKWGMLDHMRQPTSCFKDVIQKHFWLKRNEIMQQVDRWAKDASAVTSLKTQLAEEFLKLPVPQGLENFVIDTPEMNRTKLEVIAKQKVSMAAPNLLSPWANASPNQSMIGNPPAYYQGVTPYSGIFPALPYVPPMPYPPPAPQFQHWSPNFPSTSSNLYQAPFPPHNFPSYNSPSYNLLPTFNATSNLPSTSSGSSSSSNPLRKTRKF